MRPRLRRVRMITGVYRWCVALRADSGDFWINVAVGTTPAQAWHDYVNRYVPCSS